MAKGFIYIARNAAIPGLLKIGRTDRVPDQRMSELFSTGVPEPFQLVFYAMTSDTKAQEALLHKVLSRFRHNEKREFFSINSRSAIGAIMHLFDCEHIWDSGDNDTLAIEGVESHISHQSIEFSSRDSIQSEEDELYEFVSAINVASLDAFVVSAFYDSKACLCNIQLVDGLHEDHLPVHHIRTIASCTLTQYEMFGIVRHGRLLNEI